MTQETQETQEIEEMLGYIEQDIQRVKNHQTMCCRIMISKGVDVSEYVEEQLTNLYKVKNEYLTLLKTSQTKE